MNLLDTTNKVPLLHDRKVHNKFFKRHNTANVIGDLTVFINGELVWGKAIDHDAAIGFKVVAKQLTRSRFRASAIPQKQKRRPVWWSAMFEAILKDAIEKKQKELSGAKEREYQVSGGNISRMTQGNQTIESPTLSVNYKRPEDKTEREKLAQ
jgi:hypothetical protein